ncbi:MAG: MCE family protein [Deltaproteobacteria bacterium]|nr:MCE family protein [Deltaproteobacteria bacterium]
METRINYILTGLFVVVFGGLLLGGGLWLSLRTPNKNLDHHYVYIDESVSGLNQDAPVKYRGVEVGRVTEIKIDPRNPLRVRLLLAIDRETPINDNTVATLVFQGLTGVAHINLGSRRKDAPPRKAPALEKYPVILSEPSLLTRLDEDVTNLISSLTKAADHLQAFFDHDKNRMIDRTLKNLEEVSTMLAHNSQNLNNAVEAAAKTLKNSAATTESLPQLLTNLNQAGTEIKIMAREISAQSRGVGQALGDGAHEIGVTSAQVSREIGDLSLALRIFLEQAGKLVGELKRDPAMIISGQPVAAPGPGENHE